MTLIVAMLAVCVFGLFLQISGLESEIRLLNKSKELEDKLLNALVDSNKSQGEFIKSVSDLCIGVMEADMITFRYAKAVSAQVEALIELDKIKSNQIARLQNEKR